MNHIGRIQYVLAETCNDLKVNGLVGWDESEFYHEAVAVVNQIRGIALMEEAADQDEALLILLTSNIEWGIPSQYNMACFKACLEELYDELTGEG